MKRLLIILPILFCKLSSCQSPIKNSKQQAVINAKPVEVPIENSIARAYFASGCFWCVEAIYESVIGVQESVSGYAGGFTKNPTYELSNTGRTGHAEAVEVYYDPKLVSFSTLLDVYFGSQNVAQVNGQGPDRGSQYRSIVFYLEFLNLPAPQVDISTESPIGLSDHESVDSFSASSSD